VDTVGVYDPNASRFSLRNENSVGMADAIFPFGPATRGWLPIDGAWSPRKTAASLGDREPTLVLIEAEDFHAHDARQGLRWQTVTTAGHSGRSAMQIVPGNRPKVESVADGLVARLDYRILVTTPGRYYFRIRGMALGGGSNSIHVGLDGVVPVAGRNVQFGVGAGWTWSASTRYLDVTKPGAHVVNVWMRESGTVVDTIALFPRKATSAADLESLVQAGMDPVIPLPPRSPAPQPPPKQPPVTTPPPGKEPNPDGPGPSPLPTKSVTLTWRANADPVKGYRVYFGLSPKTTLVQLADFRTSNSNFPASAPRAKFRAYEDLGLRAGEQACFRLRAYDTTGVSGFSRAVCVKV
jgi:hypothetical protein